MPGNFPRPFGRHSIACSVADRLWTTTVSGPPDVWPQAVAAVSVRTSGTRTNAYSFVIWHSPITGYHGCGRLCRNGPSISSSLQSLSTQSCNSYLNRFEKGQHGWLSPGWSANRKLTQHQFSALTDGCCFRGLVFYRDINK